MTNPETTGVPGAVSGPVGLRRRRPRRGLDPELPLIEIVWWVNKELLWHAAEIWFMRDLYAATLGTRS